MSEKNNIEQILKELEKIVFWKPTNKHEENLLLVAYLEIMKKKNVN